MADDTRQTSRSDATPKWEDFSSPSSPSSPSPPTSSTPTASPNPPSPVTGKPMSGAERYNSVLPHQPNINAYGGNTPQTKPQDVGLGDAIRTISFSEYLDVRWYQQPCVRQGLLWGIGALFAAGGMGLVLRREFAMFCMTPHNADC